MDDLADIVFRAAKEYGVEFDIVDLFSRVMADERPPLRFAYVFAETMDNQDSSFLAAKEMQAQRLATRFYIPDGTPTNIGYPGYEKWFKDLAKAVGKYCVLKMEVENRNRLDTQAESESLVNLAERINNKAFYTIAPQFHMLRAFMTAASEVLTHGSQLSLFSYPGVAQPLDERVAHSQGHEFATRREFFNLEVKKIRDIRLRYNNILPAKEILDYMDGRSSQA